MVTVVAAFFLLFFLSVLAIVIAFLFLIPILLLPFSSCSYLCYSTPIHPPFPSCFCYRHGGEFFVRYLSDLLYPTLNRKFKFIFTISFHHGRLTSALISEGSKDRPSSMEITACMGCFYANEKRSCSIF